MFEIAAAAVAACVLFLIFRSTRPLGVIGIFLLVALAPAVFGTLLLLAGAAYLIFFARSDHELMPRQGAPREDRTRRRLLGTLVLAAGTAGVLALAYSPPTDDWVPPWSPEGTRSAVSDEVLVLNSQGGELQVAKVEAVEVLDARIAHRILGVNIGETQPRVRIRATYIYCVKLSPTWRMRRKGGVITALAPQLTPSLPIAIDTATIEKSVGGAWLLIPITGDRDLDVLERSISATLARKASSDTYKQRVLEESRKTIAQFIEDWAVKSGQKVHSVQVLFEGEPIRSIEPFLG